MKDNTGRRIIAHITYTCRLVPWSSPNSWLCLQGRPAGCLSQQEQSSSTPRTLHTQRFTSPPPPISQWLRSTAKPTPATARWSPLQTSWAWNTWRSPQLEAFSTSYWLSSMATVPTPSLSGTNTTWRSQGWVFGKAGRTLPLACNPTKPCC